MCPPFSRLFFLRDYFPFVDHLLFILFSICWLLVFVKDHNNSASSLWSFFRSISPSETLSVWFYLSCISPPVQYNPYIVLFHRNPFIQQYLFYSFSVFYPRVFALQYTLVFFRRHFSSRVVSHIECLINMSPLSSNIFPFWVFSRFLIFFPCKTIYKNISNSHIYISGVSSP